MKEKIATSAAPAAIGPYSQGFVTIGEKLVFTSGQIPIEPTSGVIEASGMANGAAAMGRKVTMFFTFWGLNILRRPEKVSVVKSFVEKMFGVMMPRGTKKLGLSRMNMGGAGAKMIRWIMKEKGISSLEELIDSAESPWSAYRSMSDVDGYHGYPQGGTFGRRGAGRCFYVSWLWRTVGYEPFYLTKAGGKALWQRKRILTGNMGSAHRRSIRERIMTRRQALSAGRFTWRTAISFRMTCQRSITPRPIF